MKIGKIAKFVVVSLILISGAVWASQPPLIDDVKTPVNSIQITPSPSPSPIIKQPKAVVKDIDPPVHCSVHTNCGGGTVPLKQSECSNSVCCQLGDRWVTYKDKNQCIQDQKANQPSNPKPYVSTYVDDRIDCDVYYPILDITQTYRVNPSTCNFYKSRAGTISSEDTVDVAPVDNSISEEEYKRVKAACMSEFNDKKQGIYARYGLSGSVGPAMIDILRKEYQFCFDM